MGISSSWSFKSCLNRMVSSRDGFLFSENAALGRGNAGVECSTIVVLKMSGGDRLGREG